MKQLLKTVLNKPRKEWPTVSTHSDIEYFLSRLSHRYQIPPISVLIRSKSWIGEWTKSPKAIACAWREEGELFAAFADDLITPLYPKYIFWHSRKERKFLQALIHEFVHLYLRTKHPNIVESHSPEFYSMEASLAREYGL